MTESVLARRRIPEPGSDPLLGPDPVGAATAHVAAAAFADSGPLPGRVGLELELHLVDLARPARRAIWGEVTRAVAAVPDLPRGSRVTVEPGGQVELSTPPAADAELAVAALALDLAAVRTVLADRGLGLAALGADPARTPRRTNPSARYSAMERHFEAVGCAGPGLAMMAGTAALQVNLDAGPASGWSERLARLCDLVPVLVAVSSTSPWLGGERSGWHSMRQGVWQGIDPARTALCAQAAGQDAGEAWAAYVLDAPVMLLLDDGVLRGVRERVSFRQWLEGRTDLPRRPVLADLEHHVTTLFPPVRPRGYLELRSMDAMPQRWWPAMVAVATTLADDPEAADVAAALCAPLEDGWRRAAERGLADAGIRRAALGCLDVAARRAPLGLRAEVEALHGLLEAGSSPAGELAARVAEAGPLAVLWEATGG